MRAAIQAVEVRAGQPLDLLVELRHLVLPLPALRVEEHRVDAPLQLVLIGLADEALEPVVLLPGQPDPLLGLPLDVAAGAFERLDRPLAQLRRHHEGRDDVLPDQLGDPLLAHVERVVAELRAAVVDVLLLLQLGGDCSTAVRAGQEPLEGEVAGCGPRVGEAIEALLAPAPHRLADDGGILAHVGLALPHELARVDGVPQHVVEGARVQLPALLRREPDPRRVVGEAVHRVPPRGVLLEDRLDEQRAGRVELDEALAVLASFRRTLGAGTLQRGSPGWSVKTASTTGWCCSPARRAASARRARGVEWRSGRRTSWTG